MIYIIDPKLATIAPCPTFCRIKPCYGLPGPIA
jgi:hypothetical protein